MKMLFLILFIATVVAICMHTVWSWPNPGRDEAQPRQRDEAAPDRSAREAQPESLEGVLVGQLMAAEISPPQYRHAIEGLAARDEDRHPLAVPPEIGTADA